MKPPKLGLKENIAWNSSGSLIYLIFQWLITYLVVILLGFTDAGIFTLALSISGIAFAVALYGVRGYQVSDISREYSDKTYVLARTTTSVLALGGALVYLAISAYSLYAALCIVAYLIFKISESYADVYHGIFQRDGRMDIIGKSFILRGVVSNSLAIACMAITHQLLISICVLAFTSWVLIFLYDRNKVGDFYEKSNVTSVRNIFDLLIACAPLAIYALLSSFFMYIPRISLENIMGSETLGIYASIAIPAVIIQVVSGYIFSPLLTIFAEHVSEGNFKLFRKLLIKTFTVIVALSMIVIVGGVIFGEQGLVLLFGEKIREFSYLFTPILFLSSLTALSWFIGLMLTVLRELRGLIVSSVVAALICLLFSGSFINSFGANGASFVLIVALIVQLGLMGIFMLMKVRHIKSLPTVAY